MEGSKSTLANTDTSSAVKLDAAPDAASRDEKGGDDMQKYPEGAGGQGQFPGRHSKEGYVGGPSSAKKEILEQGESVYRTQGDNSTGGSSSGTGQGQDQGQRQSDTSAQRSGQSTGSGGASTQTTDTNSSNAPKQGDTAPSYVHASASAGVRKPKGKNLTEGIDDADDGKNVSFNSDVGDENDPGRAAENKFARENAQSGADAGGGPRQKGVSGDGQYDVLEDDQAL